MANAIPRVALAFQGVHHMHGRHSLVIGMLSVLKTIANHSVQKVPPRRARLLVHVTGNPLNAAATSRRRMEGLLIIRQWPEVSDVVAHFCTLRESKKHGHARIAARETVRVFSDSRNVQKSVTTLIIYLGPLPTEDGLRDLASSFLVGAIDVVAVSHDLLHLV